LINRTRLAKEQDLKGRAVIRRGRVGEIQIEAKLTKPRKRKKE